MQRVRPLARSLPRSAIRSEVVRVIGGIYRRRRLSALPGTSTRPMLGRMRETLFDILQGQVEGRVFADLYAGTGAVGIEALSRGARCAVFVESNARAAMVIRRNLEALGAQDRAEIRVAAVREAVRGVGADIYFLGPPYAARREYAETLELLSERSAEWVIAQHGGLVELAESYGSLAKVRVVRIGGHRLALFRHALGGNDG